MTAPDILREELKEANILTCGIFAQEVLAMSTEMLTHRLLG